MTAVEWLVEQYENNFPLTFDAIEQAKEMEEKQMIEFACKVAEASAEKYIQGKTTEQIAEELLTIKS
jgi:hypothetical protein